MSRQIEELRTGRKRGLTVLLTRSCRSRRGSDCLGEKFCEQSLPWGAQRDAPCVLDSWQGTQEQEQTQSRLCSAEAVLSRSPEERRKEIYHWTDFRYILRVPETDDYLLVNDMGTESKIEEHNDTKENRKEYRRTYWESTVIDAVLKIGSSVQ